MSEGTPRDATLETVLASENLREAWLKVKANNGSPGVDKMSVKQCKEHLAKHWPVILGKLESGRYKPGAIRRATIPKDGGGTRTLGIPNVTDRVIQQAIHQVLSPHWEVDFSDHSYAYRPGRSQAEAIKTAAGYVSNGKTWVVDIDLKSFFDQVNHDKLMHLLRGKVKDKRLRALIGAYLRAPWQEADGRKTKRMLGLPQGSPLSPLLANIYLDPLDNELESRGLDFVRYADDIAIFVSSERSARRVYESVTAWLKKHLRLEVNDKKSGVGPSDQTSLLGVRIYTDGEVGISPKALRRFKNTVRELWDARQPLTSNQLRDQWQKYVRGWWGYFQIVDRRWEIRDQSSWIRRHIRKCFWLRWKSIRGRFRNLQKLGVQGRSLGTAYCSKGAWRSARTPAMHKALTNRTLARYGFDLPWETLGR